MAVYDFVNWFKNSHHARCYPTETALVAFLIARLDVEGYEGPAFEQELFGRLKTYAPAAAIPRLKIVAREGLARYSTPDAPTDNDLFRRAFEGLPVDHHTIAQEMKKPAAQGSVCSSSVLVSLRLISGTDRLALEKIEALAEVPFQVAKSPFQLTLEMSEEDLAQRLGVASISMFELIRDEKIPGVVLLGQCTNMSAILVDLEAVTAQFGFDQTEEGITNTIKRFID